MDNRHPIHFQKSDVYRMSVYMHELWDDWILKDFKTKMIVHYIYIKLNFIYFFLKSISFSYASKCASFLPKLHELKLSFPDPFHKLEAQKLLFCFRVDEKREDPFTGEERHRHPKEGTFCAWVKSTQGIFKNIYINYYFWNSICYWKSTEQQKTIITTEQ